LRFSYEILTQKITKLCFGFEIFWRLNIGKKIARNVLMKLTEGFNFTNILLQPFLYKSVLHTFTVITVWLCDFLAKRN